MLSRAFSPILSFTDLLGHPLSGGILYTYISGTNEPVATLKDKNGSLNEPAIRLNSRGECEVWLDTSIKYRFVVKNAVGVTIMDKNDVTTEAKEFTADGADGIHVQEEQTDEGRTVLHFSIADDSIAWSKLKSPRHLIADTDWIEFEAQPNSDYVVVSLAKRVRDWLEEHMDG